MFVQKLSKGSYRVTIKTTKELKTYVVEKNFDYSEDENGKFNGWNIVDTEAKEVIDTWPTLRVCKEMIGKWEVLGEKNSPR